MFGRPHNFAAFFGASKLIIPKILLAKNGLAIFESLLCYKPSHRDAGAKSLSNA